MSMASTWDPDLLRRYAQPGPRYTSYPTAPQFTSSYREAEFRTDAQRSNEDPIPRQLSVYVHVPFCANPCFYCGCNRVVTRDATRGDLYLQRLLREVSRVAELFDRDRQVVQIHLGGGTPNFLTPRQIGVLMRSLAANFSVSPLPARDISIEIDPRCVSGADIAALAALGFNRASLGVQDFDPAVQAAVNREQSVEQTLDIIDACHRSGMRSVNVDLIYGLPEQTAAGFGRTLQTVLEVRPDRLAIHAYAHVPELFRAQRQINADRLPSPEEKLGLLQLAIETLSAAGYCHVGMDHFALPSDELILAQSRGQLQRNFMGYTTHARTDLIGLGVSAISRIGDSYAQSVRDLPSWEIAVDADRLPIWRGLRLSADDRVRADVIQQIMCSGEVDMRATGHRHQLDFGATFASELAQIAALQEEGLVELEPGWIRATPRGRLLLRVIAMCFDAYLGAPGTAPARFSAVL